MVCPSQPGLSDLTTRYQTLTGEWLQVDILHAAKPTVPSKTTKNSTPHGKLGPDFTWANPRNKMATELHVSAIKDQIMDFHQLAFHYGLKANYQSETELTKSYSFGTHLLQTWARQHPFLYLATNHNMHYIPVLSATTGKISIQYGMNISEFENIVPLFARTLEDTPNFPVDRVGRCQFKFSPPNETIDSVKDLVSSTETPPGLIWPFDLRQIHNGHYRRWFFDQNRPFPDSDKKNALIRQSTLKDIDSSDSENLLYNVVDMLAFYNGQDVSQRAQNHEMYRQLITSYPVLAAMLQACRDAYLIRVEKESKEDYMRKLPPITLATCLAIQFL